MLEKFCPILPSRNLEDTETFWLRLGFVTRFKDDDGQYLAMEREQAEVHFWLCPTLNPATNSAGAFLRPSDIDALDAEWRALGLPDTGIPRFMGAEDKPWGMCELAMIDGDGNLIRAGQEQALG